MEPCSLMAATTAHQCFTDAGRHHQHPVLLTADSMTELQVARPLVKTVAAAVSLGSGASLGPEGPSVEIGKAFADGLGSVLRSRPRHMLSLMAAGSGAGGCNWSSPCRWNALPTSQMLEGLQMGGHQG